MKKPTDITRKRKANKSSTKPEAEILYLAYGSNLNTKQMKKRCPLSKVVGKTELKDYQLVFKGMSGGGIATVIPAKGCYVPVLIWKLQPQDEKNLDSYEGYPALYHKEHCNIQLDGKSHKVMLYVLNESFYGFTAPSERYKETILDGYREAGFDEQILEEAISYKNDTNVSPLTKKIIDQIMVIRDEGLTNMFDTSMVQYLASQHGFHELVLFIKDHKNLYFDFIMYGKRSS